MNQNQGPMNRNLYRKMTAGVASLALLWGVVSCAPVIGSNEGSSYVPTLTGSVVLKKDCSVVVEATCFEAERGAPVVGVLVHEVDDAGNVLSTKTIETDSMGRFAEALGAGKYVLEVDPEDSAAIVTAEILQIASWRVTDPNVSVKSAP